MSWGELHSFPGVSSHWRGLEVKLDALEAQTDKAGGALLLPPWPRRGSAIFSGRRNSS